MVPISHQPNPGGYFIKRWGTADQQIQEPFHRFIYRAHNGQNSIPEGWEIDHHCGNRFCCNPRHLRALSRAEHLDVTNRLRFAERNEAARLLWLAHGKTLRGGDLVQMLGIPKTTANRWIRAWETDERVEADRLQSIIKKARVIPTPTQGPPLVH